MPSQRPQRHAIVAGIAALLALMAVIAGLRDAPRERVALAPAAPVTIASAPWFGPSAGKRDAELQPEPVPATQAPIASTPRALIEQALQSQDLRLRTQAWRLLRHCAFFLTPGNVPPLVSPPPWMKWESVRSAQQAWQSLAGRCEPLRDLLDRERLQRRLDPVPAFAADGDDPAEIEGRWLARTFEQHGGAALLWAGDTLASYLEERTSRADGDAFEPLDPEAVQIARCRFGEECGADSDAAQAACLTLGACEGDVPQRLLAALGSRAARERVMRQANTLTDALANGDLSRYALGR